MGQSQAAEQLETQGLNSGFDVSSAIAAVPLSYLFLSCEKYHHILIKRDRRNLSIILVFLMLFLLEKICGGRTLKFTEFIVCARPLEILISLSHKPRKLS